MRRWIAAFVLVVLELALTGSFVDAAPKIAIINVQGMVCSG